MPPLVLLLLLLLLLLMLLPVLESFATQRGCIDCDEGRYA
eukprot:SAG11_NODE_11721_length_742_cov_0.911353_2_plen_39_part_01